jgi:hypothetical protein
MTRLFSFVKASQATLLSQALVPATQPLQSHSRLWRNYKLLSQTPCFVEKTSAKTILNCFHPRFPAGGAKKGNSRLCLEFPFLYFIYVSDLSVSSFVTVCVLPTVRRAVPSER